MSVTKVTTSRKKWKLGRFSVSQFIVLLSPPQVGSRQLLPQFIFCEINMRRMYYLSSKLLLLLLVLLEQQKWRKKKKKKRRNELSL